MDCNKNGCPGMAHPCSRISFEAARARHRGGEVSLPVAAAAFLQCHTYEHEIQQLKDELLEAYRKAR